MIRGIVGLACLIIFTICACALSFAAQEERVILGAGLRYSTQPYTDVDEDFNAVPLIIGRYKDFYSDGTSFGYIFRELKQANLELSAVLKPRFMGYHSDDSATLAGMEDREWSLDGGLRVAWDNDYFLLKLTGLADLTNEHQGQEFSAVASKELFAGLITPRVGVKWQSDDIVDYYYGVLGSEATGTRAAYKGDSTVNFLAGATVAVPIGEKWTAILDFEYENLGSEIQDSPIVDSEEILTYVAGAVYRF